MKTFFISASMLIMSGIGFAEEPQPQMITIPSGPPEIVDWAPSTKKFPYRIPFDEHTTVKVSELKNKVDGKPVGIIVFAPENKDDTVFAMRRGSVIDVSTVKSPLNRADKNGNPKNEGDKMVCGIKIKHSDGTVAEYVGIGLGKSFVQVGDAVDPSTPLGIVAETPSVVCAVLFVYVKDNQLYSFFPHFALASGLTSVPAEGTQKWTPYLDDKMMTADMSRSERKKYDAMHNIKP